MKREIEAFLAGCGRAALVEPGEPSIAIRPDAFLIEVQSGRLLLHAWDAKRSLARQIVDVRPAERGRLDVVIERFGARAGRLTFYDQDGRRGVPLALRGQRDVFLAAFRKMLRRQFAGWRLAEVTTGADLENSLSPAFPRALLWRGTTGWAAMAAPAHGDASRALTFGLIWIDYLRRRESPRRVEGLALFLPLGSERAACQRIRFLDRSNARYSLFAYDGEMWEAPLDLADAGNLETNLHPPPRGITESRHPEALLESVVRTNLERLDPRLRAAPVYGQVAALAGIERGVADLLAVEHDGRLAVIELKTEEDPHLPLQALDYWMRVAHHAREGGFGAAGYFPGVRLRRDAPRLLLVAPAVRFHPTTERVLAFLSPEIEVERIGLGVEWQKTVHVVFRGFGARRPEWA